MRAARTRPRRSGWSCTCIRKMSNMDALTDTASVIKQAISWGHPAIAITDHGVAQSFPDAWHAAKGKIKILYGVEGYFVNNLDDRIAVHGPQDIRILPTRSCASTLRPRA